MRNIMFYPASRKVKPHIDSEGTVHVCISEWNKLLKRDKTKDAKISWVDRAIIPNYPTNGTSQPGQD